MKRQTLIALVAALALFQNCSSDTGNNTEDDKASYEESKANVEEKERSQPVEYLVINNPTYRKNALGKWVLEGTVTNNASMTTYRNIELKVIYYNGLDSEMGHEKAVIEETVEPGATLPFKLKVDDYDMTESLEYEVAYAEVVE